LNVLLLSVGPDGHIALLFPRSNALLEKSRLVLPVISPKTPPERLTITPRVVQSSKSTFLLAQGKEKGRILAQAQKQTDDIASFPVCLLLGSKWMLDYEASNQLDFSNLK